MASQAQPTNFDLYKFLNITLNSDGSLTRPTTLQITQLNPRLTTDSKLSLHKDIPLNSTTGTFLRLYRPATAPPAQKLPIIIYFHGGGFILASATTTFIHLTCIDISAHSPAVIVSLEYRLAPEHRLPAAYDDGLDAILWVRDQALRSEVDGCDEWLSEFADFSRVFLMGTSAGGNLTYNAGLRALDVDLDPIKIIGLILDQPFFGGVERTEAELRLVSDHVLPLAATDLMWSLALPAGFDRDHQYSNPLLDRDRFSNEHINRLPTCLIRVNGEDPMIDRQKDFANMLEACGVHVIRKFYEEGCHGAELFDAKKAEILYGDVKNFIWLD